MSDERDDEEKGASFDRRMRLIWVVVIVAMIAVTTLELLGVRPK